MCEETATATQSTELYTLSYEVFGQVQRVFMRKYTVKAAQTFQLTSGCVYNTETGTVKGQACGTLTNLKQFTTWLATQGSPKSQITHAECTTPKKVAKDPYGGTFIKKKVVMSNGTQWAGKVNAGKK